VIISLNVKGGPKIFSWEKGGHRKKRLGTTAIQHNSYQTILWDIPYKNTIGFLLLTFSVSLFTFESIIRGNDVSFSVLLFLFKVINLNESI